MSQPSFQKSHNPNQYNIDSEMSERSNTSSIISSKYTKSVIQFVVYFPLKAIQTLVHECASDKWKNRLLQVKHAQKIMIIVSRTLREPSENSEFLECKFFRQDY